ncbi:MAG TPA: glutamate ABC transporter substrate-binding protein [Solirubrobacteraceae bacterium]|jgi:ABC-type amino acid transport substrate-binding protein|nr:glutamate ABC transporter substrate-binding protein [Solirubrobacteraceae bacterium]
MQKTRWLTALALALGVLAVGGCGDDDKSAGSATTTAAAPAKSFAAGTTMAKLQKAGEITIGVKFDVPPFGRKDPGSGEVEGFDIDLAKAIAEAVGAKPKYIEALSDNRIAFLKDGTADLILSTMTINPERDKEIDFSEPYFVARGRILVKKDSDIAGVQDLAGKKVCTALGSTYEETLKKQAPKAERKLVDSYSECLELIQNGGVDAVSTDDVILTGMIIQDDTLKLVGGDLTTEPYGVGIKQGDDAFKEFVDGVVADYKKDGRWATAYQKWVGQYTGEKQEPPTMTLQEALAVSK